MEMLRKAVGFMDSLGKAAARFTQWFILVFVVVTIYDVALRYFFQAPTLWARELVSLLFGPMWLLAGAYLVTTDEQVRMDLVFHRFSTRKKAIFDLFTFTLFFFYFGTMVYYGWQDWWSSLVNNEHTRTVWRPVLWPFKLAIPVSISLLLITGLGKYIRDLHVAVTGRTWDGD